LGHQLLFVERDFESDAFALLSPTRPLKAVATDYYQYSRNILFTYGTILRPEKFERKTFLKGLLEESNLVGEAGKLVLGSMALTVTPFNVPLFYSFSHSANVALLTTMIAVHLKLSQKEKQEVALAGFYHNVGNYLSRQDLIFKRKNFSDEESKEMRKHAQLGYDLLVKHDFSEGVCAAAPQHHEHWNGKGFPAGIRGQEIHLYAQICSIADLYDALISERPHATPFARPLAVELMKAIDGKFAPEPFKAFLALVNQLVN